ncbi:hypothetical protein ACC755_38380, partial [Rhizobium ruizarguesonis]
MAKAPNFPRLPPAFRGFGSTGLTIFAPASYVLNGRSGSDAAFVGGDDQRGSDEEDEHYQPEEN